MAKSRTKADPDKLEYMPLYPKDFMDDTQTWSDQEVGFYFRLLCYNWTQKEIPADPMRIINIAGGATGGVRTVYTPHGDATTGTTTGTPPVTHLVTNGTTGAPEHPIYSHDRLTMWQHIKQKFISGKLGGLVNKRVEFERSKILQYFERQRENSLKAVAAKKKKREDYLRKLASELVSPPSANGATSGTTGGTTQPPTSGEPSRVPIMYLNNSLLKEEFIGNSPEPVVQPVVQPVVEPVVDPPLVQPKPDSLPPAAWVAELPEVYQRYYVMTFDQLQAQGASVGNGVTVKSFARWKRFVEKAATGGYTDFFKFQFLKPRDFPTLTDQKGFTEDRWEETLEKICASTIDPSFNPYHRIPQFMAYKKNGQPLVTRLTQSSSPPEWAIKKAEKQRADVKGMLERREIEQEQYDYFIKNQVLGRDLGEIMQPYDDAKAVTSAKETG